MKYSTLLLLASLFISFFSGSDFGSILKVAGRRITFALSPFAFLLITQRSISSVKEKTLEGIKIGVLLSSIFLITNIFQEYYLTREVFTIDKDILNFYHTSFNFTKVLGIHPSYYGVFVLTGSAVVYFYKGFRIKILNPIFIILSIITILFLNSRIILFLFFALNFIFFIQYFYNKSQKAIGTLILLGSVSIVLAGGLFYLTKGTYAYQRVVKETMWELTYQVNSNYNSKGSGDSRVARWSAALNVIFEKPILGHGVYNEREVLRKEYKKMNMKSAYESRYNAHNQFLGFAIEGGVFSVIILLLFFGSNFYASLKNKDMFYFFLVLSIFFICLIENYLVRNAGIVFTSFFLSMNLFDAQENYNEIT